MYLNKTPQRLATWGLLLGVRSCRRWVLRTGTGTEFDVFSMGPESSAYSMGPDELEYDLSHFLGDTLLYRVFSLPDP